MMPTAKLTECIVVFFVSYHSVAQNVSFFFQFLSVSVHWYQILGYFFHLDQFEVHHTAALPFPQFPEDVGLK